MIWWGQNQPKVLKTILSPDKQIKFTLFYKKHEIFYQITKNQTIIVEESKLDIDIKETDFLRANFNFIGATTLSHQETIEMPWGEEQFIKNNYIETNFNFQNFNLRVRVFDDGVAFRYEILENPSKNLTITNELTEFNISPAATAWQIPAYQPDRYEYNYEPKKVSELKDSVHTPLTINLPSGEYLSIHEAALYDYGAMTIKLNENGRLFADITPLSDGTKANVETPFQTPWRVIMIAKNAIDLTKNRLIYCLNDPPKGDFSWVETLKFIGIWWAMYVGEWTWAPGENHGATTTHAKAYIDAAKRLNIPGLLIEGWNEGWEGDWLENGAFNSFTTATPDFNLEEVASYARAKGVELVGHHETVGFVDNYESQIEKAYNYYAANGIKYIKTGYAGSKITIGGKLEYHHSQVGVNHYQRTVELAAKKHICLDIHEPIKGTGIERTFPNLLSREGARGQEYEGGALSPSHACILPFTRLVAGGMDYTNGIFDLLNDHKRVYTTLSRQLAYFITIYSGMAMAADRPFIYEERFPEVFEFVKSVPTNFAKTVPLSGEIGEYYIVARKDRDSDNWYVGGVTNEEGRTLKINFDFLEKPKYRAKFYLDSNDADYLKNPFGHQVSSRVIKKGEKIEIYLAPGGGFAISLEPLPADDA